jgi:hypothetical protein
MAVSIVNKKRGTTGRQETVPIKIPGTAEDLWAVDCWLQSVCLTNTHTDIVTVTLADKQTSPLPVISAASIAAGETLTIPFDDRLCPSGLTWLASVADKVVGYVRARI